MGLDSYIYRTKKVAGLTAEDYKNVNNAVSELDFKKDFVSIENLMDENLYKPIYGELNEVVIQRGNVISWCSIFEDVGYLRKANAIHNFFVQETQEGCDECDLSIVPKNVLEELLERCEQVLNLKHIYLNDGIIKNGIGAEEILPTTSGFFFGGTEFDEWYFQYVSDTKEIITKVLADTDFDKQIICYQASW